MKRLLTICLVGIILMALNGVVNAAGTFNYTVAPSDLADGPTFANGQGGVPFGYDPDMPPPIGRRQPGPVGFGDSCFWSDVQGSAAGGPRDYTAFRMSPKDIFGLTDVTINDLAKISYYTKNMDTDKIDWQIKIYTESDLKWYGYRFNFTRPDNPDNAWYLSSTDTNLRVSDIYDKEAGGSIPVPDDGELSDLYVSYGAEKILFIDIIAGYATSSPPVDSYLDGVQIVLSDSSVATMDLVLPCATIKDGTILYSAGHYMEGFPIMLGNDSFGYNYQAHKFNGSYYNYNTGGLPPYEGDDDVYYQRLVDEEFAISIVKAQELMAGKGTWPYRDTDLIMKWNDAWLSNKDCDGDGKLDRYLGFDSYIGSGAWLTNHMSGSYEAQLNGKTKTAHWTYFVKIVAVPSDAHMGVAENEEDPTKWYNADGVEIGTSIWGAFAIIQQVENDPFAGINGKQYGSPAGPGFGQYAP
ncbi:MAG: hypothetical protein ACYSUY_09610 [Planctomycetota bacterium]|jgi:hypothetical protein